MKPPVTPNQWTIAEALIGGPMWTRSFQTVKPLLIDLIERGLIERCRPHLGRGCNMVRLTHSGCEALEIDPGLVTDKRKPAVAPPPRGLQLGAISPDATPEARSVCEAFIRALRSGTAPGEAVAELSAQHGVQRPAIWKRLRSGGVLPQYERRTPHQSYADKKRSAAAYASRKTSLREREANAPRVDRDPCPRCGVRHDIGCNHSRAPIGMMF